MDSAKRETGQFKTVLLVGLLVLSGCVGRSATTSVPAPPTATQRSVPTRPATNPPPPPSPTNTLVVQPTSTLGPNDPPRNSSEVPRITPEELKAHLKSDEAILIVDARSVSQFQMQHIPGAVSVPLEQIEARLDAFPRDQEIVFYCI